MGLSGSSSSVGGLSRSSSPLYAAGNPSLRSRSLHITYLSCGNDATLISSFHFIVLCLDQALDFFCFFDPFHGFICAPLRVLNPIFFFNFRGVNFFLSTVYEEDVAVLIEVCV